PRYCGGFRTDEPGQHAGESGKLAASPPRSARRAPRPGDHYAGAVLLRPLERLRRLGSPTQAQAEVGAAESCVRRVRWPPLGGANQFEHQLIWSPVTELM